MVSFEDDSPLATGGEFRIRRSKVSLDGRHVGNIYASLPEGIPISESNRHTQAGTFYFSPLGKFNQPEFHGEKFETLTGCKRSLM